MRKSLSSNKSTTSWVPSLIDPDATGQLHETKGQNDTDRRALGQPPQMTDFTRQREARHYRSASS